jgi:competence protein ComEC
MRSLVIPQRLRWGWAGDIASAWSEAERGRLALFLPVAMGAGDLLYFSLDAEPAGWIGAACLLMFGLAGVLLRPWGAARCSVALLAAAALGFGAAQWATWRAPPPANLPRRAVIITGAVSLMEALPEGRRVTLAQPALGDGHALARLLRIRLRRDDAGAINSGDVLRVRAMVRPPAPPSYPGAWDLQRDAWFGGLAGYGYALGAAEIVTPHRDGSLAGLRARIAARVMSVVSGTEGAIAAVLLTGLPAAIPEADRAAFRGSGLAHLLAIAGLHIGIVMGLVMGLTRRTLVLSEWVALHWPVKQIAAVAALGAGGGYALLTGLHVPIMRSFAMAALVVLGLLAGRRAVSLRGLAVAAAVIIVVAPEEVVGVSFQMSFSAVLALIAGYGALRPLLRRVHGRAWHQRVFGHVVGLVLTSLLAGAASAPFAAYHFGQVQLYFIVANVVAVPLTAFWVMPAGLVSLALMPFGLDGGMLRAMGAGVHAVLWVGRMVSAWPAATLSVPHMPAWGLTLVGIGMAWLGLYRSRIRLAGLPALVIGLISPILVPPADMLVSADARVIAVRTDLGMVEQVAPGADRFVKDAFAEYWGRPKPQELVCATDACLIRPRTGGDAVLVLRDTLTDPPCDAAVLAVSAEPIRRSCPDLTRIDRFTVWREGAQAVWLSPLRIVSDAGWRGHRPWVAMPADRRDVMDLPMAQTEGN